MKTRITILFFMVAVCQSWSDQEISESGESTSRQYWEMTKELYEQTKGLGEGLFAADTNALERIIRHFYDRAKEAGEQVPTDMMEWARQDIKQIGSWEYRILEVEANDLQSLEKLLNSLGSSRWECFWVEETDTGKRFYLKKTGRSYLRSIPSGDLLKLIPGNSRQ